MEHPLQPSERATMAGQRPAQRGDGIAWHAMSILLAGPLTWGGIGWFIDRLAGTERLYLPIGIVVGAITAFYLVIVRFGRTRD